MGWVGTYPGPIHARSIPASLPLGPIRFHQTLPRNLRFSGGIFRRSTVTSFGRRQQQQAQLREIASLSIYPMTVALCCPCMDEMS